MEVKIIEYKEIKRIKQSEKGTVLLVREMNGEKVFVKKTLKGHHPVYSELKNCAHPYLPKLYEVMVSDDTTTVYEEYVDGQSLGSAQLSEKQIVHAVKELCSVLEYLHGKDIIHRDIKPSNIIIANDGHIRLVDFDAARMPKENLEQDTRLLGTRGYAPPEQYGFAQTDARADIYSLGVTMNQLLGHKGHKLRYRRIIAKCTNLNPDKRYQSARQVKKAYSRIEWNIFFLVTGIILIVVLCYTIPPYLPVQQEDVQSGTALTVLPAPENPHWNGDMGIAVWGNVPQSGIGGELLYKWRLYRQDTATPPDLNKTMWDQESSMKGNKVNGINYPTYEVNLGTDFWENGFYYFAVSAVGDGISFSDSPYVLSDAFEYTGENAPPLPPATGLEWKLLDDGLYATWDNMDDYADKDTFSVRVYDKSGTMVSRNIWTKEEIESIGRSGIWFASKLFAEADDAYRFTVQAQTSRPNEFRSSLMPEPVPEEYYSPWYYPSDGKK